MSEREVELEEMFTRMKDCLAYGSTALIRVNTSENAGQDVVPVVIARKVPTPWDHTFSTDGMFLNGHVMVWIHDLGQLQGGGSRSFEVSTEAVSHNNQRAVPLTTVVALGMPMTSYLCQSAEKPECWMLLLSAIKEARSHAVRMSVNPAKAFVDCHQTVLEESEEEMAPMCSQGRFAEGTLVESRLRAPMVYVHGRRAQAAWRGPKAFEGKGVRQLPIVFRAGIRMKCFGVGR